MTVNEYMEAYFKVNGVKVAQQKQEEPQVKFMMLDERSMKRLEEYHKNYADAISSLWEHCFPLLGYCQRCLKHPAKTDYDGKGTFICWKCDRELNNNHY